MRPADLILPHTIHECSLGTCWLGFHSGTHFIENGGGTVAFHLGGFCAGFKIREGVAVAFAVHRHLVRGRPQAGEVVGVGHV